MAAGTTSAELQAPTPQEREKPLLPFRRYAIAFHFAAAWNRDGDPNEPGTPAERAIQSYEDDMLLHAHRDDAPFGTCVSPAAIEVTVRFPPQQTYAAEGSTKSVECADADEAGRLRRFRVFLGETRFERSETAFERRRLAVLTLVLTPLGPRSVDSELNEYDVIKLVKLWEGGEGLVDPSGVVAPSAIIEGQDVWFATKPRERATLHSLAVGAFPGWRPLSSNEEAAAAARNGSLAVRAFPRWQAVRSTGLDFETTARTGYRVGTVELELGSSAWRKHLFEDIETLKSGGEPPTDERWKLAVAVGGILQGLLDFRAIEDDELADVFADVEIDAASETMRAFHKGTLLSLSAEEEPDAKREKRRSPIGVDPYLAVPNIVLLHNEHRLKSARLHELDLSQRQHRPLNEFKARAGIHQTENGLSEMARLLAQDLPNVFHYPSERRLQKQGSESRGLDDLHTFMRLRIDDLSSVLESRARRRDRWTAVLGIAVGVVTAFLVQQSIEGRPSWLIVLVLALFAAFLWLRDKVF